jgi:hypothetical protein
MKRWLEMRKIALRISVLTLIVAAAFYCGRVTTIEKPGATTPDQTESALFTLSDLPSRSRQCRKIEFQLQKSFLAMEWNDVDLPAFPSQDTGVPNHPDVRYRLAWNEQTERFLFDGKPLDYKREIGWWEYDWGREPSEQPRTIWPL